MYQIVKPTDHPRPCDYAPPGATSTVRERSGDEDNRPLHHVGIARPS